MIYWHSQSYFRLNSITTSRNELYSSKYSTNADKFFRHRLTRFAAVRFKLSNLKIPVKCVEQQRGSVTSIRHGSECDAPRLISSDCARCAITSFVMYLVRTIETVYSHTDTCFEISSAKPVFP